MAASRTLPDTLREVRRLARGSQRRAARLPEVAPLVARLLGSCQTVAIEKRPAGFAIHLQLPKEVVEDCRIICVFHNEDALPLTPSERAVAQQLCDGRTLAQIA